MRIGNECLGGNGASTEVQIGLGEISVTSASVIESKNAFHKLYTRTSTRPPKLALAAAVTVGTAYVVVQTGGIAALALIKAVNMLF